MDVITVFEQETLRLGEERNGVCFTVEHYDALARFVMQEDRRFFSLGYRSVRFSQYVGVIQVGKVVLEILPKVDRKREGRADQWRYFLLEMLSYCRLLKVERSSPANLSVRAGILLDMYFDQFLGEVEQLLREGLLRTYHRRRGELAVLKGRLLFDKQLRRHPVHRERFYVEYDGYDYDHFFNQVIGEALQVLRGLSLAPTLQSRLSRIRRHFPDTTALPFSRLDWATLHFDRHTERYRSAILIAQLILQGYTPDLQQGRYPLIAILFDMNQLFEEYVFRQLAQIRDVNLRVRRQEQRPFWRRQYLRPDIILEIQGETLILDTKWKVLHQVRPDANDLRQIYVYSQYFGARRGVLLYPDVHGLPDLSPEPYHPTSESQESFSCQVCFLNFFRDGKLNRNLGEEILERLGYR